MFKKSNLVYFTLTLIILLTGGYFILNNFQSIKNFGAGNTLVKPKKEVKTNRVELGSGSFIESRGVYTRLSTGPSDKWHTGATNPGGMMRANLDYLKNMFDKYSNGKILEIYYFERPDLNPKQSLAEAKGTSYWLYVETEGNIERRYYSLQLPFYTEQSKFFNNNINFQIEDFIERSFGQTNSEIAKISLPYRLFLEEIK